jgi:hypothetical protein
MPNAILSNGSAAISNRPCRTTVSDAGFTGLAKSPGASCRQDLPNISRDLYVNSKKAGYRNTSEPLAG